MDELLVSREGRLGHIRLNRPRSLNSLTLPMVRGFTRALNDFGVDEHICAVLVTGAGDRGLCAGGDIRALYALPVEGRALFKEFWRQEYELNARIASFPKPYVVIMDGVVMGGGVGISAHGNRRVTTERTRIAMPEVGIGFFPDVGGSWLLSRAGEVGIYMALSGAAVTAPDAIDAGLADLVINADEIARLTASLSDIGAAADVDAVLARFAEQAPPGPVSLQEPFLKAMTSHGKIADILAALKHEGSESSCRIAQEIASKSPTSLKVTHALLRRAAVSARLEMCLENEFKAACRMLSTNDLYEGIRAAIIDKDRNPQWSPRTLDKVSDARIDDILAGDGTALPEFKSWSAAPYGPWEARSSGG